MFQCLSYLKNFFVEIRWVHQKLQIFKCTMLKFRFSRLRRHLKIQSWTCVHTRHCSTHFSACWNWIELICHAGRRFTPVGEGGSGRRPLPPQSLNILVGLILKLLSLYGIVVLVGNNWTVGCFINNLMAWKVCFGVSGQNIGFMKNGSETIE